LASRGSPRKHEAIVFKSEKDVPLMAVSLGTMLFNKTGTWKNIEPFYTDKTPPCNELCPAGEDIVRQLYLIKERRFKEAVDLLKTENPFPATCGRVCPHFCERECNRKELGGSISIRAEERFLGDFALRSGWKLEKRPRKGKRVAVIGAGPAGLSAALFLTRFGHTVTVFDEQKKPGGMMRAGIPRYRLPRDVLDGEIEQVLSSGIRLECGARLGDSLKWDDLRKFDAICLATGFHKSRDLGIPGEDLKGVLSGVQLLNDLNSGKRVTLGKNVGIVGGGNTAMDVARSVKRMGKRPIVLYRRTRQEMPAIAEEVEEAIEEGVEIRFLVAPVKITGKSGKISQLECIRMKLGPPDESGRRRPVPIRGTNFRLRLDNLVRAIGEEADLSYAPAGIKKDWRLMIDEYGATSLRGIFACGDVATGKGTVVHAIGSGKSAALAIASYLAGKRRPLPERAVRFSSREYDKKVTRFQDLNLYYFDHEERITQPKLSLKMRTKSSREVTLGLKEADAVREAERCMSCGTCNLCEKCFTFCPDLAVRWEKGRKALLFDYDYCTGCGICSEECPRDAIDMREVLRTAGGSGP
jgi:NADPH-dependent glutamate synthase beta subunit-like oxidoreductase